MTIRFIHAVPQFTVPDLASTARYYRDVLGFEIAGYWDGERVTHDEASRPVFGIVKRGEVQLFLNQADRPEVRRDRAEGAYDVYFHVRGVDALAAELLARGARILDGPEDRVYGQRELVIEDCNGMVLAFGEEHPQ
jgi:catechol 2,3-dioxygenase-like lactoylglutathione lyase family enzyme